jgi:alanine racemase
VRAQGLLTSDKYATLKAESYGVKAMNIAYIVREAYNAKIMTASEVLALAEKFINQNILDTLYIRQLREEAKQWQ